jgi:hypothetical protein
MFKLDRKGVTILATTMLAVLIALLVNSMLSDQNVQAQSGSGLRIIVHVEAGSNERVDVSLRSGGYSDYLTMRTNHQGRGTDDFRVPAGVISVGEGFTVTAQNNCDSTREYGENSPARAPEQVYIFLEPCHFDDFDDFDDHR